MLKYITAFPRVVRTPLHPEGSTAFTHNDFNNFMDWMESELDEVACNVENGGTTFPPEAFSMLRGVYIDARKAVAERTPFVLTIDARYEDTVGSYLVWAQVQSQQLSSNAPN
jgi:hypothetical protein